jgi:hypothetical protein
MMSRLGLVLLVLSSIVCSAFGDDGARGYLLVHKTLSTDSGIAHLYAEQQTITVNITLYNVGEG